jgi:hypothetical protein
LVFLNIQDAEGRRKTEEEMTNAYEAREWFRLKDD